jgi:hypothetical protein
MNGSTAAAPEATPSPTERPSRSGKVLCAYSPRWLSGPTPGYRGLCATWSGDEPTAEHPVAHTN